MKILAKGSHEQMDNADFDGYELYLVEEDLFNNLDLLKSKLSSKVETIHTPHVGYDKYQRAIELCDELAQEFNASIVCHSSYIRPLMANNEFDFSVIESEYGIENHWGLSIPQIERSIFEKGHNLVLDVAHLYVTNPGLYKRNLSYLLFEYPDKISNIHFCDSTTEEDGLHIGEGEMSLKDTLEKIVKSEYDNDMVVEVPVEGRVESVRKTYEMLSEVK
jgi:sugar phosphate isomerase/epimerase